MKKLKEIKNYLKAHTFYFYFAIFLFLFGIYLGALKKILFFEDALKEMKNLALIFKKIPSFGIFLLIFLNNTLAIFFIIFLGIFLGIAPFFALILNGGLLGTLFSKKIYPPFLILVGIIPHGVIEIPILILAGGLGLKLGQEVIKKLLFRNFNLKEELSMAMGIFLKIILPALFLSSLIETFITPFIISWKI